MAGFSNPPKDCSLCPRLQEFRHKNREVEPGWFNAPVPAFGPLDASLLVVGLAPGLKGANCTGRPFTGDYAGIVLYPTLLRQGFAEGEYEESPKDGLRMKDCRITNAVRCVPPQNKPNTEEIRTCRQHFLVPEIHAMPNLRAIIALGRIAHDSLLKLFDASAKEHVFRHGHCHQLEDTTQQRKITLFDSYHCSRYNINTGRLTEAMFEDVVRSARKLLTES